MRSIQHWTGTALAVFLAFLSTLALAAEPPAEARQVWQLLDYIAVDYAGAVRDGAVADPGEYAEMREFAEAVRTKLDGLSPVQERARLLSAADALAASVEGKVSPSIVAQQAHTLADVVLTAYGIVAAPASIPDVVGAAPVYARHCAGCHGAQGRGDGPAAAALTPPPIDFTDRARAAQRSPLALYQVISQGLDGTAMAAYPQLTEQERWALAYYVGTLPYNEAAHARGETLWAEYDKAHPAIPTLAALSQASASDLSTTMSAEDAEALIGFLRRRPDVLSATEPTGASSFGLARGKLADSLAAYRAGNRTGASTQALSAYLDGIEPLEAALAARDRKLMHDIEGAMAAYRTQIAAGESIEVLTTQVGTVNRLFEQAEKMLAARDGDATTAFVGSFTILLREGIEALLVVIGMIAFLRKAERHEVLPYVHAGWLGALVAGALTWGVATYMVAISGANREITEGVSSLFAAIVLLSVGIWMHQKSLAGRWQQYLHAKMSAALTRRSAFFLFLLAFVAVYREVFETILFYAAMWSEATRHAILAGLGAGSVVLALVAFALLRFSKRLPIAKFFSISSMLIAVLAVVLVGKGIAALQEAGWVLQGLVAAPRIDWLGVYPSWPSLLAQLTVALVAVAGFLANTRSVKPDRT